MKLQQQYDLFKEWLHEQDRNHLLVIQHKKTRKIKCVCRDGLMFTWKNKKKTRKTLSKLFSEYEITGPAVTAVEYDKYYRPFS